MIKDEFVKKLEKELQVVKLGMTTAPITASELWDKSYEYVIKQGIVDMFLGEYNQLYRYSDELLEEIMEEENTLDYLYGVWKASDYMLQGAFADTFYEELLYRRGNGDE